MIHCDFEQGSQDWLESRRGVITGSRFRDARDRTAKGLPSTKSITYARDLARERCGGVVPSIFQNEAMRTGQEQEPIARGAYELRTGRLVEPVGFFKTEDNCFGVSPDGLIDDDGVLEIKTMVSSNTLFTAMAEGDISEYVDQCNGYLWLLGRQWVDLVLWAPDLEDLGLQMVIHRIKRNEDAIEKLEADMLAFSITVREYESKLRKAANKQKETA